MRPLIHLSQAARADFLDDAIVAEGLADHVRMAGILRRGLQSINVPVTLTVQARVQGAIHLTHAALADEDGGFIRAEAGYQGPAPQLSVGV